MSAMSSDITGDNPMGSNVDARSRIFGRTVGRATFRSSCVSQEYNRLKMFGSNSDFENMPERTFTSNFHKRMNQSLRTTNETNRIRTFGLQSRIAEELPEDRYKDVDETHRSYMSTVSRTFGLISDDPCRRNKYSSTVQRPFEMLKDDSRVSFLKKDEMLKRNNSLSSFMLKNFGSYQEGSFRLNQDLRSSNTLDRARYNEPVVDDGGFRRPLLSRVIRGRNSTLSSRLLHEQRHCKDLSNLSVNVSNIPRREVDTLSESQLALNRFNWMDNQSVVSSFVSVNSMKSQFMNVLESLHNSILNIGPHLTADAISMEIERAKEKIEIISERSLVPSVKDAVETSVISHSSKYANPPMSESSVTNTLDGGLHLKSSQDIIKMLSSGKDRVQSEEKEKTKTSLQRGKPDDENPLEVVFKKPKPKPLVKKCWSGKAKTTQAVKKVTSKDTENVINLQQWYPIANGSELAFCGVDEEGATVKTVAVKKRLNNRKVELINGLSCNLIGSPSAMISELPRKITALLRNGLTDRWRVLQKELLNCQTAEEEKKKRVSKSPKKKSSPEKNKRLPGSSPEKKKISGSPKNSPTKKFRGSPRNKSPPKEKKKKIVSTPRIKRSPLKSKRISKSPKAVPSLKKNKITSKSSKASPEKKNKKSYKRKPKTKSSEVTNTPLRKATEIQTRSGRNVKPPSMFWLNTIKSSEVTSVKTLKGKRAEKEAKEEVNLHSTVDDTKKQNKSKRKRKIVCEGDSVQSKKSKVEKKTKGEMEVLVEVVEPTTKKRKGVKTKAVATRSTKSKKKESKSSKKKIVNTFTDDKKEMEIVESEEDCELSLDDIHVPEVARLSEDPLLSRSQLRLAALETPPLKYFNNNLKLLKSVTPVQSPDWHISQRTESEARKFQKRREEAFKHTKVDMKKTVIEKTTTKTVQSRDLKRMLDWMAEKTVRSPQWGSKVLQYVIPSRKRMEMEEDENEDEDEEIETEFL